MRLACSDGNPSVHEATGSVLPAGAAAMRRRRSSAGEIGFTSTSSAPAARHASRISSSSSPESTATQIDPPVHRLELCDQLGAAHRHVESTSAMSGRRDLGEAQRRVAIGRRAHVEADARERGRQRAAHHRVVVGDQHADAHAALRGLLGLRCRAESRSRSTARHSSWHTRDGVIRSVSAIS